MDEVQDPKESAEISNTLTNILKITVIIVMIYVVITIFGIQIFNDDFKNYIRNNGETILSLSVILFSLLVLISIFKNDMINNSEKNKILRKEVTIENFDINEDSAVIKKFSNLETNKIDVSFCQNNKSSSEKDANCKKLTKNNCITVGCCVLLNGEKCVGGGESGPTYLSEDGKDIDVQYYYYKDQCKGKGCPKVNK
jgi:hypothetical protein